MMMMMSLRSSFPQWAVATMLLLLASTTVEEAKAFDASRCDVLVARTKENALWHCGNPLPTTTDTGKYCDHSQGDKNIRPFAWKASYPDEWCAFFAATVRGDAATNNTEGTYPLTPSVPLSMTPGPNIYFFSAVVDWGCYILNDAKDKVVESYLVDSRNGKVGSTTTTQCERTQSYFDYFNLNAQIRDLIWYGAMPKSTYTPQKQAWSQCFFDDVVAAPFFFPSQDITHQECLPGFVCEYKTAGYAGCYPDPKYDHECCVSWNNKCSKQGDCCYGSECNANGYCEVGLTPKYENPPGICESRQTKTDRAVWTRCFNHTADSIDDCAPGYVCTGNKLYAQCEIDTSVKNECCKWNWETSNPRPGDCCLGWMAHCHVRDPVTGACTQSQCIPGRETGVNEWGDSMLDVHDRMCRDTPPLAGWKEKLYTCEGAVCGVWGDPHIITCDNLHYDCQAVGLFTAMKNQMFNIQMNFVSIKTAWGGASITNDIAIDYLKDNGAIPTVQISFPDFDKIDKNNQVYDSRSRKIGACPVMLYLDGTMVNISAVPDKGYLYGDANSDLSIKLSSTWNQIDIKYAAGTDVNGTKYYSESIIWIEGGGPFEEWSCILSHFICLPNNEEEEFQKSSVGLLGTPNSNPQDDWMTVEGQTLVIPAKNRTKAAFDYCLSNWCVDQNSSIITYEEGLTYADYKCTEQPYYEFDVNKCADADKIVKACKSHKQQVHCMMEMCAGSDSTKKDEEIIENITKLETDPEENIPEFPNLPEKDYGDCANLGAGLSGATGTGAYTLTYPKIQSINSGGGTFTTGYDGSVSVLVGGKFHCKAGAGFEGRGVFLGDLTLDEKACGRLVATAHGSLIHPRDASTCIEVAGDVSIASRVDSPKHIMYEYENTDRGCHVMYGGDCTINGGACPNNITSLGEHFLFTTGEFKKDTTLNLTRWNDELTRLSQKTAFWKSQTANGVVTVEDGVMTFGAGPDNKSVQIFNIKRIDSTVHNVVFKKELTSKTIMIIVDGAGDFHVPVMCFHPADSTHNSAPICGKDTFPPSLTSSIAWVFTTRGTIQAEGRAEFQGSIVIPDGDLIFRASGHSGRMLVGGDLTVSGSDTELHNYEFDPASHPLPLGADLGNVCRIQTPPTCDDTVKPLISTTACPTRPEGIVKLLSSSAAVPEGEPILYDIILGDSVGTNSAKTVKFKVDSPYTNYTDIYVKHVKKVGRFGMNPTCESMPFTAGCNWEAPTIEVGCHEYKGIDAFALVNLYFVSNDDSDLLAVGSKNVTIDKCCKPSSEYASGSYGIVEFTFEVQCTCPTSVAAS